MRTENPFEERSMRRTPWFVSACFLLIVSAGVESRQQGGLTPEQLAIVPTREPSWAFQVQHASLPPMPPGPKRLPGSAREFTMEEVDNLMAPPDWMPDEHGPAPAIVVKGRAAAPACGSCHLMSGIGHPESADVSGLSAQYFVQTMMDFKSGARKDIARMNGIAGALTDQEIKEAADWFATLRFRKNNRVVEADTVPKTIVAQGRMRFVDPAGGTEPIGQRIIVLPEDVERARLRDPNSAFVNYVPTGTLARGKALVETGDNGKTVACNICHGGNLLGQAPSIGPRLGGVHPIYLVRQMYLFKEGSRAGTNAAMMTPVVAKLTDEDILAISAYLGSLDPTVK
jgi:cytochrome c553